jgi:RNA polymerase sigma factor (sigma-70 family)
MDCERSVTEWIQDVQQGKSGDATQELFERFYGRLIGLARKRMGNLHAYEDEQDVAISAMKSFFLRAPEGKFPKLTDRNSLWSLLAVITLNKAASLQRRQLAKKRDVRRNISVEEMLQSGPSEKLLDSVFQEGNCLLDKLKDESLKQVAQMRMEGYTNQEIAERMDIVQSTVKRKLSVIRKHLESELGKMFES